MRTIYFSGAISGGREDVGLYRRIVSALEADGHRVLAGAVADERVGDGGESLGAEAIFERDLAWIAEADLMVAEVSRPSAGVGFEIAAAQYHCRIPVICLYRPAFTTRCSAMIAGNRDVRLIEYQEDGIEGMLDRLRAALA
jgi:hypothetical protein